jgi:hypothetical protein
MDLRRDAGRLVNLSVIIPDDVTPSNTRKRIWTGEEMRFTGALTQGLKLFNYLLGNGISDIMIKVTFAFDVDDPLHLTR